MFYAYVHCRPDGSVFYVGKGDEKRSRYIPRKHNDRHNKTVAKYGRENILLGRMECSTSEIACDLEVGLIKRLRAMGVDLANCTSGGESGFFHTTESREKLSASLKKRPFMARGPTPDAVALKISRAQGGTPVSASKDEDVLVFDTIVAAGRALGIDPANITNHLKRSGRGPVRGCSGWVFERIK